MNRLLAAGIVTLAFPVLATAQSPPLVVLSSNATRAALQQLAPDMERVAGRAVELRFANSADLRARIEQGERFDVAVLTAPAIDALAANGKLARDSRADVAKAGVGLAIRTGTTPPDISTPDALKKAFVAARSVALVGQGATASIVRGIFDRFGIAVQMQAKTRLVLGAAEAVARGDAEMGLTQISEILPVAGATLAGPLPGELQVFTQFRAAAAAGSAAPELARAVIAIIASPSSAGTITASGMQPSHAADRLPPVPCRG